MLADLCDRSALTTRVEIIRPKIFENHSSVIAACSTRVGGVSPAPYDLNLSFNVHDDRSNVIRNREIFFGNLHIGLDELAIPMQCHSVNVRYANTCGGFENTDGLFTKEFGIFLVVSVADCVPVLLYDPVQKVVAAVHAGWKGTAAKIVSKAVGKLCEQCGTQAKDIVAWIGPSAGSCCYEVAKEVADRFEKKAVTQKTDKYFVDLKCANYSQLICEGVSHSSIEISTHCTIHEKELFHSFRRDGKASGRMMAAIGLVR